MAIYQRCRGFELGTTVNKSSEQSGWDLNLGPPNCQVQRSNRSAMLPPQQPSKASSRKYVVKLITCFWNRF